VEGSVDGRRFEPIGEVTADSTPNRRFYFNDDRRWRYVRLRPSSGKTCTVTEIAPLESRAVVIDAGEPSSRRFLASGWSGNECDTARSWAWAISVAPTVVAPMEPGRDYRATFHLAPNWNRQAAQSVEVLVSGVLVGGWRLLEGWNVYSVVIPGRLVEPQTTITIRCAYTAVPALVIANRDPRRLAVALDRLVLRPTENRPRIRRPKGTPPTRS
jgi:hypothetical protein